MSDFGILLVGGLIGFLTTLVLESVKNMWENKKNKGIHLREIRKTRKEAISDFLEKQSPYPAWLKIHAVINGEREFQLFLLGKRISDEARTVPSHPKLMRLWELNQQLRRTPEPIVNNDINIFNKMKEVKASTKFLSENHSAIQELDNRSLKVQGTKFFLSGSNLIGREGDCDIVLPFDEAISRKHALIVFRNGRYVLHDLTPTNGCWVNGNIVLRNSSIILEPDDIILIGDTLLEFNTGFEETITADPTLERPALDSVSQAGENLDDHGDAEKKDGISRQ